MSKLKNYEVRTDSGFLTRIRLTEEQAKKRGLTEATAPNKARGTTGQGRKAPDPLSPEVTDLSAYKVGDVEKYLEGADDAERQRVIGLEVERGDKARKGIVEWTPPAGDD